MNKLQWTPWHQVVRLRDDLKSGELPLAIFAADLYDVAMGKAKPVYQEPSEFFALTYPTFNLRQLAKDVVTRLAGRSDKAVRELALTYGGGKTHSLITLWHLVNEPSKLPDLPAVKEFIEHIGLNPPKARIAVLPFDKLDVEKGMEARGPQGEKRWLKYPWSVLAFEIAGAEGLKVLFPGGEERDSVPAENLLTDLIAIPAKDGLATLILIDEVLMYAREKVRTDPAWKSALTTFFQYLSQAVTKVDRCAIVASLLATDPAKSDEVGKQIAQELFAVFAREKEEGVMPVQKEDVAEVLRRRFFTPDSIRDHGAFSSHVVAALRGIERLDDNTAKDLKGAEEKFLQSYPFHPDLIDVLYTKWTQLENFQRTRGVLRTFALALRSAERFDECPLVAANAFLAEPGAEGLSEAARELAGIATYEEYEGKRQNWHGIIEGELAKAREIQAESGSLKFREIEQAVLATFLHSQPVGQRAQTRELMTLLGHTRPDKIELEKGLLRWAETSWFLDEGALVDVQRLETRGRQLPKSWRLGSRPNLRQMHHDACQRISSDLVESRLMDEITRAKRLTEGASAAGAKVHTVPQRPSDVDDDGEFHFVIMGPRAASDSGKPSTEAKRFIDETSSADKPRNYRNSLVLVAPSRDGLEAARSRIREYSGWEEVRTLLKDETKGQEVDPIREETLARNISAAKARIPEAILAAYCIVVTVSEKNEVQAFKISPDTNPLFPRVKEDKRSRIQEVAVTASALLPDGPYNLWREGETSLRFRDLVGAFALSPKLPKMLNRGAILDTLVQGCKEGQFVIKAPRPDRTARTFWREPPDDVALKDPALEVVLPGAAELADLPATLLVPGNLPGLWKSDTTITFGEIAAYFAGGKVVEVKEDLFDEPFMIPKAARPVIESAVRTAVKERRLWLVSGPASLLGEEIPAGLLNDDACLRPPPAPIAANSLSPESLAEAWEGEATTAIAIAAALDKRAGVALPWAVVQEGIDGAIRARVLELAVDSGPWPCDYTGTRNVKLRVPASKPPPLPPPPRPGILIAAAELTPTKIAELADRLSDIKVATAGLELKFQLSIQLRCPDSSDARVAAANEVLKAITPELALK